MTTYGGENAHRVFVPQALGGDEFLRVTWHERNGVFVFSHWEREMCVAATPVRIEELGDLATMIVTALGQHAATAAASDMASNLASNTASNTASEMTTWAAPAAADRVHAEFALPA